jgi:hypothetical protein
LHCERKELVSLIKLVENSNLDHLYSKPECNVVSRAFPMSKNTAAVNKLMLKLRVTWSVSLIHCSVVLWHARKPNWLPLSKPLSSMCFWTIFRMTLSNSLPFVDRRHVNVEGILIPYRVLVMLWLFLPSMALEYGTAGGSDYINVSSVPMALEGAWGIHLECHQFRRTFSFWKN